MSDLSKEIEKLNDNDVDISTEILSKILNIDNNSDITEILKKCTQCVVDELKSSHSNEININYLLTIAQSVSNKIGPMIDDIKINKISAAISRSV
jgi:hypothetical protein